MFNLDRYRKAAIINMFKELKETTFKELKENMITMIYHIENINKEMEFTMKSQMDTLELKSLITKMKNSLKRLNSIFELVE